MLVSLTVLSLAFDSLHREPSLGERAYAPLENEPDEGGVTGVGEGRVGEGLADGGGVCEPCGFRLSFCFTPIGKDRSC